MTMTHQGPAAAAVATGNARPAAGAGPESSAAPAAQATDPPQTDQLDQVLTLLNRWSGGMASLWTYSISHGKLVLRLTKPSMRGNLHLMLFDCRRICAPTFWGNTAVQVQEESTPEGRRFVVRDDAAKVEIRCGYVVAAENVEPVY